MKKVFISIISIILTFSLCACAAESPNTPEPQPPTSETSDSPEPQPPISETPDSPKPQNLYEIAGMPAPFDGGGGDGHKNYLECCINKFSGVNTIFSDKYAEYLGVNELNWEWAEYMRGDYEGSIIPHMTGIMDFQNIYSLAVINNIPIEIVIATIDEYNEFYVDLMMRLSGSADDEGDFLLYTEEDKAALLTQDEETILRHFASPYVIVIGDKVYTPAWLYTHTPEDFRAVGITPEMIAEKIDLFAELNLTEEAITAFESKLSEFMETSVTINRTSSY